MDSIDCFPLCHSITKLEMQASTSTGYGYYAPYATTSAARPPSTTAAYSPRKPHPSAADYPEIDPALFYGS